ncbi:MAG: hypothetical protein M1825_002892, partial [Sarcosagium campestre]
FRGSEIDNNAAVPVFRLLALGDPQIEGNSALQPDSAPSNKNTATGMALVRAVQQPLRSLEKARKRIDLLGNDYYLAHIYRTLRWWTQPTTVVVLGDLLGSQWISDDEFERRGARFWERIFRGGHRVEDVLAESREPHIFGADTKEWERRVVNVAGNHDIGYAGDMTASRVHRFERVFGKVNWETRFTFPPNEPDATLGDDPEIRLIVLNSLNLDTPALEPGLQSQTYDFINEVIGSAKPAEDKSQVTLVLTHLPLHKEDGVCVDGPLFKWYDEYYGGGMREQNHISYDAGRAILEGIFGARSDSATASSAVGRNGIIMTGHDHEGCDVYHFISPKSRDPDGKERQWTALPWTQAQEYATNETIPGVREVTVRSMMGDFGGNAGLLSVWYDRNASRWHLEYDTCSVGVQHIWWAVHILDLLTVCAVIPWIFSGDWSLPRPKGKDEGTITTDEPRSLPKATRHTRATGAEPVQHHRNAKGRSGAKRN